MKVINIESPLHSHDVIVKPLKTFSFLPHGISINVKYYVFNYNLCDTLLLI